jgi:hypothetical protein
MDEIKREMVEAMDINQRQALIRQLKREYEALGDPPPGLKPSGLRRAKAPLVISQESVLDRLHRFLFLAAHRKATSRFHRWDLRLPGFTLFLREIAA